MLHVERASTQQSASCAEALPTQIPRLADFRFHDKSSLVSMVVIRGAVRAFDFAIIVALGLAIALLYVDEPIVVGNAAFLIAVIGIGLTTVAAFELLQLYSLPALTSFIRQMPRVFLGWTAAFALLIAGLFFLKVGHEFSRVWFALWYAAGAVALMAERLCRRHGRAPLDPPGAPLPPRRHLRWRHHHRKRSSTSSRSTSTATCASWASSTTAETIASTASSPAIRVSAGLSDLVEFARKTRLDVVIIALPITAERRLVQLARLLSVLPAEVKIPARATELRFTRDTYSHVGNVAMIDLLEKPIADWGTVAKWLFDKVVALLALLLLAPVMLAVAAAIKLDSPGPVLFRQKRHGFNNELIEIFKFRSMYVDRCDAHAANLVTKDDPRVTARRPLHPQDEPR